MNRFEKTISVACYFFGVFLSGIILIIERKNLALRFNALQAFFFHMFLLIIFVPLACLGTWIMLNLSKNVGLGLLISSTVIQIIFAFLWIYLLIQAIRTTKPKLPILTKLTNKALHITD